MRRALILAAFLALCGASPAAAVEYRLLVANLHEGGFTHFFDGPLGTGSGELVMNRLEKALDSADVGSGARLSDRAADREGTMAGIRAAMAALKAEGALPARVAGRSDRAPNGIRSSRSGPRGGVAWPACR